jgi:hypothetical protein
MLGFIPGALPQCEAPLLGCQTIAGSAAADLDKASRSAGSNLSREGFAVLHSSRVSPQKEPIAAQGKPHGER